MCRIHTEIMFPQCGHTHFKQRNTQDCDCTTDLLRMTMNEERTCPRCHTKGYYDPYNRLTGKERAYVKDWLRRRLDFRAVHKIIQAQRLPPPDASYPRPDGSNTVSQSNRLVPLDHQLDELLTDFHDFVSPTIKVVPLGTIHPDKERCAACWGNLTISSRNLEESCSGAGARMLPCGHIFGQKCLARTFTFQRGRPPRNWEDIFMSTLS